jgi:hypothetical protein
MLRGPVLLPPGRAVSLRPPPPDAMRPEEEQRPAAHHAPRAPAIAVDRTATVA